MKPNLFGECFITVILSVLLARTSQEITEHNIISNIQTFRRHLVTQHSIVSANTFIVWFCFGGKTNPSLPNLESKIYFPRQNYKCGSKSVTAGGRIMFLRICEDKMIFEIIQFSDMIWFSPKMARGEILTKYQRYFWILYIENIPPQKLGSFHLGPTCYICPL